MNNVQNDLKFLNLKLKIFSDIVNSRFEDILYGTRKTILQEISKKIPELVTKIIKLTKDSDEQDFDIIQSEYQNLVKEYAELKKKYKNINHERDSL